MFTRLDPSFSLGNSDMEYFNICIIIKVLQEIYTGARLLPNMNWVLVL